MNAQELRIGNIIKNGKHIVTVDAVINYPNKKVIGASGNTLGCEVDFEEFEGIQLTEEILIICGFEKADDGYGGYLSPQFQDCEIRLVKDEFSWFWYCMVNAVTRTPYLHQLQNLYYSLTGMELPIDIKLLSPKDQITSRQSINSKNSKQDK